jgi:hypothetical protein
MQPGHIGPGKELSANEATVGRQSGDIAVVCSPSNDNAEASRGMDVIGWVAVVVGGLWAGTSAI